VRNVNVKTNFLPLTGKWAEAISDAKRELEQAKSRVKKLRAAIRIFQRLAEAGEPWPGTPPQRNQPHV